MSKNKFPILKILILVTILAVPGFLYYLLQAKGKNRYKPLPIFGPKVVAATFHTKRGEKIPDTIYHQIPAVKFVTSKGDTLDLTKIRKQLIIVNFFYSRNTNPLKAMNNSIKALYKEYKNNRMIRFLSISVDDKFDKPAVLRDYAKSIGAKPNKWDVVVADSAIVYPLAQKQFYVNALKGKGREPDFIFSDQLILLDAEHRIRGYYKGTSGDEGKRLNDEIKVLITEELRKIKSNY